MRQNIYSTKEQTVISAISGGREHFTHREPVKSYDTYKYTLNYGENFYGLSAIIFSDDTNWWVLSDINPPRDVFSYTMGEEVNLPTTLVQPGRTIPKFF